MKRISCLAVLLPLCLSPALRAEDAATEERLNKLAGQIEDLRAGQDALHKQIAALVKEVDALRDQTARPTGNFASQEDLKRLAELLKEVDQKRLDDAEKIRTELLNLRKSLLAPAPTQKKAAMAAPAERAERPPADKPEKGFEYEVKKGDTLSIIV